MKIALFLVILQCALQIEGKRVLFIPFFQASHVASFVNLGQAFAEFNHEIYVCIPQFTVDKGIINTTNVRVIPYGQDLGDIDGDWFRETGVARGYWDDSTGPIQLTFTIPAITNTLMYNILTSVSFLSALEKVKPEFIVLDAIPVMSNFLILPHKFKIPFATIGVSYNVVGARVPFSPAALPHVIFRDSFNSQPTFLQRLMRSGIYLAMFLWDPFWDPKIAKTLLPGEPAPSSASILAKASLYLIESDVVLGYAYPMLPNTIMIGGTSSIPAKPLSEKFEKIVKNSPDGIVLVSFGSAVAKFPPEAVDKMTRAFETLPFHVMWRVDITSPDIKKITTSTWLPQNDLLGHKEGNTTRAFISHCGGWSQYEALYHGVPMLCFPMFADQFFNAHRMHDKGFGKFADIRTISTEELAALIHEVAYNDTYRENIKNASKLYRELYTNPVHDAAYWIDHVMRTGGLHLRSVGQDLPLYQFLLLDVLAFTAFCIFVFMSLVFLALRCCWVRCRGRAKATKRTKRE